MLVVSHINLLHIHVSTYAKNVVVLARTVRFLTAVEFVLVCLSAKQKMIGC